MDTEVDRQLARSIILPRNLPLTRLFSHHPAADQSECYRQLRADLTSCDRAVNLKHLPPYPDLLTRAQCPLYGVTHFDGGQGIDVGLSGFPDLGHFVWQLYHAPLIDLEPVEQGL